MNRIGCSDATAGPIINETTHKKSGISNVKESNGKKGIRYANMIIKYY